MVHRQINVDRQGTIPLDLSSFSSNPSNRETFFRSFTDMADLLEFLRPSPISESPTERTHQVMLNYYFFKLPSIFFLIAELWGIGIIGSAEER